METFVKSFLQKTSLYTLVSIAFLAGSVSLELSFFGSELQFILTVITVSVIIFLVQFYFKENLDNVLTGVSILLGALLNFDIIWSSLFLFLSLLGTSLTVLRFSNFYFVAAIAHAADVFSTLLLLPNGSEANVLIATLMDYTDPVSGLVLSKIVFIGFPMIYSHRSLNLSQQRIFLKAVFVLGLSMAFRNLIIFIGVIS